MIEAELLAFFVVEGPNVLAHAYNTAFIWPQQAGEHGKQCAFARAGGPHH